MAAPKGNNYWEFRNKHGREHTYTPESFWTEAVGYFEWISKKQWNKHESIKSGDRSGTTMTVPVTTPMSIGSFCIFADICEDTFSNYLKADGYEDFFGVTKQIRAIIESQQFEGATIGVFNPNIIARKLGLTDKLDVTSDGDKIQNVNPILEVKIIKPDEE